MKMIAAYWAEFIASGGGGGRGEWNGDIPAESAWRGAGLCLRKRSQAVLKTRYNWSMALAIFAMRVLEIMFFVGLAGSAVVVLISFVEDGKELFGKD